MKKNALWMLQGLVILLVFVWYGLFLVQKIDLTTADIGRHIKNGEVLLTSPWSQKLALWRTNFYSFSEQNEPFINHHWGAGVVFYLIEKATGFAGLSIFYLILGGAAFWLFFNIAKKASGALIAATLSVLLIPLMASRAEVRPEMFTYFFAGVFFWLLWRYHRSELRRNWLFLLPIIEIIWVNFHIGFFFGELLIMIFLIGELFPFSRTQTKKIIFLGLILLLSFLATLINPNGFQGASYPCRIFQHYGYLIVENQSIRFLGKLGHTQGLHFGLFKLGVGLLVLSFLINLSKKQIPPLFLFLFGALVSVMAFMGIRNFPFFGFFALPIIALNLSFLQQLKKKHIFVACGLIILGSAVNDYAILKERVQTFGLGLMPNVNASAEFLKEQKIQGQIFNNYDIGGYLIYHFYPSQRVFVDNRPEAYSISFFQETYIPSQQNEAKWQDLDQKYNFNVIFFSHRDFTPWGQNFLIRKVQGTDWAPVFVDGYNIIFLKRNKQNQELIQRYEIPKERFGVLKNLP